MNNTQVIVKPGWSADNGSDVIKLHIEAGPVTAYAVVQNNSITIEIDAAFGLTRTFEFHQDLTGHLMFTTGTKETPQ